MKAPMQIEIADLVVGLLMVGMTISVGMAAYQLSRPTVTGANLTQNIRSRDNGVRYPSHGVGYPQLPL